jgi:hypothetical protein
MVEGEADTEVGAIPVSLMVIVLDIHTVLLQPPIALRYRVCVPVPRAAVVKDKESPEPRPT